jgi:putative transposase
MTYPLVRDLADDGIPVTVTCRVLGFSTQGFYKWRANPISDRDWDDAHLIDAIVAIHADDPEFGYRFIADELAAAGHAASENRVQRLCALQKIASSILRKRRGSGKTPGPPVHDDHVGRVFHADRPDRIWLTDISEHPTSEGKLYICAVKDVCSRKIVGYAIGPRMTSHLADAALRTAIARRAPTGTVVVHSDRGGQPSSDHIATSAPCGLTASSARWAGSRPRATTPRWRASSHCYRRTSSTARPGPPARSSAWRSSPGSNAPTTSADGNAPSASSPRSSTKPSSARLTSHNQQDPHNPRQPRSGQTPSSEVRDGSLRTERHIGTRGYGTFGSAFSINGFDPRARLATLVRPTCVTRRGAAPRSPARRPAHARRAARSRCRSRRPGL